MTSGTTSWTSSAVMSPSPARSSTPAGSCTNSARAVASLSSVDTKSYSVCSCGASTGLETVNSCSVSVSPCAWIKSLSFEYEVCVHVVT